MIKKNEPDSILYIKMIVVLLILTKDTAWKSKEIRVFHTLDKWIA